MNKTVKITLIIIAMALVLIVLAKGLSKEDNWICENGQWVKHGNPSVPVPTEACATIPAPEVPKEIRQINLYYYNPKLDQDENGNVLCSRKGLVAVKREITITQTPIQDSIKLLLRGELTAQERSQGLTTEYPLPELILREASLKDGILTLDFDDPQNKTSGGSCRAGILWFQIEATAKQFSEVKEVKFLPEDIFQP